MIKQRVYFGLLFISLGLGACSPGDYEASMAGKEAYSVLEVQMQKLTANPIRALYVFSRNAEDSRFDTLAFPIESANDKYFIVIANAKSADQILKIWKKDEKNFKISRSTFVEISRKGYASEPVQRYLSGHISS